LTVASPELLRLATQHVVKFLAEIYHNIIIAVYTILKTLQTMQLCVCRYSMEFKALSSTHSASVFFSVTSVAIYSCLVWVNKFNNLFVKFVRYKPVLMAQTFVNSTNYCFQHNILVVVNIVFILCIPCCTDGSSLLSYFVHLMHLLAVLAVLWFLCPQ